MPSRYLVESARGLGLEVIDRCNLTVLLEPGQETLAQFLADNQVGSLAFAVGHTICMDHQSLSNTSEKLPGYIASSMAPCADLCVNASQLAQNKKCCPARSHYLNAAPVLTYARAQYSLHQSAAQSCPLQSTIISVQPCTYSAFAGKLVTLYTA